MKIIQYPEVEAHVFDKAPARGVKGRVVIGKNDGAENFCMRVFELSPGGHTPRHTHAWEHEIFVHAGKGAVLRDGTWHEIEKTHVVFIPGNEEHQLKNTGDDTLVFVCLVPSNAPEI
ncbi:cupin domain-containing protein [Desulforhabdus amnigena]|jgi:quercetin dioxygenase-like cupin family protein|uniref:Cupin n=1 Tax=Desulforhabdus amnigena TaxID=40218 RepID=A0A9W6D3E5_9BACT|nr:cupin domain-containing protein [Desulforhabdus amnigena]NLJ28438.1 cupin domain-containing protein [Deltaproteobacteria bacterium]GLI33460.1 cupin [Desulforhabdus amnigena]